MPVTRPVIILAKEKDYFDVRGSEAAYGRLRKLYALLGAEENVGLFVGPTYHGYSEENRMAIKVYNPENAKKNTIFLRLIEADDGRINLVAVDGVTGKYGEGAHILGISKDGVIVYKYTDTSLGIRVDSQGYAWFKREDE